MSEANKVWSKSTPNVGEIREFIKAIKEKKVSQGTIDLFEMAAGETPAVRLHINLRNLLHQLEAKPVDNVLVDGLSDAERKALVEIEGKGINSRLREVGHGLLNVHERWELSRRFQAAFQVARENVTQRVRHTGWKAIPTPDVVSPATDKQ